MPGNQYGAIARRRRIYRVNAHIRRHIGASFMFFSVTTRLSIERIDVGERSGGCGLRITSPTSCTLKVYLVAAKVLQANV